MRHERPEIHVYLLYWEVAFERNIFVNFHSKPI